jgi:hypothetical protein
MAEAYQEAQKEQMLLQKVCYAFAVRGEEEAEAWTSECPAATLLGVERSFHLGRLNKRARDAAASWG